MTRQQCSLKGTTSAVRSLVIMGFCAFPCVTFAGEWTSVSVVGNVQYTSTDQTLFVQRSDAGNWTSGGCPWVTLTLNSSYPGTKELLSIVLVAKTTGASVKFFGVCNTSDGMFTAHLVSMP
jgi:hypothetical protein